MSEIKQYDTEVRLEAVMGTNHYGVHIHAMTKEDLHSKSDIAVELAWRDLRIEQLIAQLEAAQKERDALREVHIGAGSNTRAAADIYFQLVEELEVPAGGSLVGVIENLKAELSAANEKLNKPIYMTKYSVTEVMEISGHSADYAEGWVAANAWAIHNIKAAGFTVEGNADA
ncbi:TPA: hypothetical protein PXN76_002536 [Yersinia enterocolitica]|nr:hypothetical protein [Yersinia enterocolitica]